MEITVGTKTSTATFFMVDSTASYRALFGRDQIQFHANAYIPSSFHQVLLIQKGNEVEIVWANEDPFQAQNDRIDTCYYYTALGLLKMQLGAKIKKEGRTLLTKYTDKQLK